MNDLIFHKTMNSVKHLAYLIKHRLIMYLFTRAGHGADKVYGWCYLLFSGEAPGIGTLQAIPVVRDRPGPIHSTEWVLHQGYDDIFLRDFLAIMKRIMPPSIKRAICQVCIQWILSMFEDEVLVEAGEADPCVEPVPRDRFFHRAMAMPGHLFLDTARKLFLKVIAMRMFARHSFAYKKDDLHTPPERMVNGAGPGVRPSPSTARKISTHILPIRI